tara:strand:+ start:1878 stop:2057 length:180 start_codon:yes stop_codon:yes gene_type:complete
MSETQKTKLYLDIEYVLGDNVDIADGFFMQVVQDYFDSLCGEIFSKVEISQDIGCGVVE